MAITTQRNDIMVQEEFISVDGIKTAVLKIGDHKNILQDNDQRRLVLIIPGNPGVPYFYEDFMQELYHQSEAKVPVWTIGHAGHLRPPGETLSLSDVYSTQEEHYGLEAQIAHKVNFIHENIPPDVSLILIGHSIGSYIILNMLDHLPASQVEHCFLLFPTLERMAVSPNGQQMTPILQYLRWLIVIFTLFFSIIPIKYRFNIIHWWLGNVDYQPCVQKALVETVSPWTVNYSTYLAKLEMNKVKELQKDLIRKYSRKLSFYYGKCDHWAPKLYYDDLIKEFPRIDARLCDLNMKHAFVLEAKEGRDMAKIVWRWARFHNQSTPCQVGDGHGDEALGTPYEQDCH